MLDMTTNQKEKETYITDLKHNDEQITINYANGQINTEKFIEHNLHAYRYRMEEQVKKYSADFIEKRKVAYIIVTMEQFGALIVGLMGLNFIYDIDINIVMKNIFRVLLLVAAFLITSITQGAKNYLAKETAECLTYKEYLKKRQSFKYYDCEKQEERDVLNIEEISQNNLTTADLDEIIKRLQEFKETYGDDIADLKLTYTKKNDKIPPIS